MFFGRLRRHSTKWNTVESLEFVSLIFSWFSWEALPHELTSSTKTNLDKVKFSSKIENRHIHEIIPPQICKNLIINEN